MGTMGGKGAIDRGGEDLNVGKSLKEAGVDDDREGVTGTRAVARRWNADCYTTAQSTKYSRTSSTTIVPKLGAFQGTLASQYERKRGEETCQKLKMHCGLRLLPSLLRRQGHTVGKRWNGTEYNIQAWPREISSRVSIDCMASIQSDPEMAWTKQGE